MNLETLQDRDHFGNWLNAVGLVDMGVEVGVEFGKNAESILNSWRGRILFLVDVWHPLYVYKDCMKRMERFGDRARMFRGDSVDAAVRFSDDTLDFVYIDADHSYDFVMRDLVAWLPKVRHGGIFCGHDFAIDDVRRALEEFVPAHNLPNPHVTPCTSWWIIKQ